MKISREYIIKLKESEVKGVIRILNKLDRGWLIESERAKGNNNWLSKEEENIVDELYDELVSAVNSGAGHYEG